MVTKKVAKAGKISPSHLGLTLGLFALIWHAAWVILVGIGIAKPLIDWVLPLHFVGAMFSITTFNFINAILLVVLSFLGGFICGWIFAALWNWVIRAVKN